MTFSRLATVVTLAIALGALHAPSATAQDSARARRRPPRQIVPMDSARAAMLYVSNRPADLPQGDYEGQIAEKRRTDSIFAALSAGVM